jgi:hypothetical protein
MPLSVDRSVSTDPFRSIHVDQPLSIKSASTKPWSTKPLTAQFTEFPDAADTIAACRSRAAFLRAFPPP